MPHAPRPATELERLPPLGGAILIGGASRRMGLAKHALELGGATFVETIARALAAVAEPVIVVGAGALPASLAVLERRGDPPGLRGPAAGIVAALSAAPERAWLMAACDQPRLTLLALRWLIAQRRPGVDAVQPRLAAERIEPFPGIYEPSALPALLELASAGGRGASLQRLGEGARVASPLVPPAYAPAFLGANTPEELARLASAEPDR